MTNKLKKWGSIFVMILNAGCIIVALAALPAHYLNPAKWWPFALAGLLFPGSILLVAFFGLCWLFFNAKKALYSFITLLICIPAIYITYGTHIFSSFNNEKTAATIRILTWNVGLMNYHTLDTLQAKEYNNIIFKKIKESNADIVCLQEFFTSVEPAHRHNLMDSISHMLQYPYYYFSRDVPKFDGKYYVGTIIYSRFKMIDSSRHPFPFTGLYGGSSIKTGIVAGKDTVDIVSARLQLMRFNAEEYQELSSIKHISDSSFINSRSLIGKLRSGYHFLAQQALTVQDAIKQSKNRPVIFAGDINDVPMSYTYAAIKGNMHDAWANGGKGFGKTFQYISPTLRLDEIFYTSNFKLKQVKRMMQQGETDRNGVLADLLIQK